MAETEVKKKKVLTAKQRQAIEMLTCGKGYTFKEIAETVGINPKTLWDWRNLPEYTHFQEALDKINTERWQAAEDAARQAAIRLCKADNQKMVQFVLQNAGYNPTQKVEAEVKGDIVINIED